MFVGHEDIVTDSVPCDEYCWCVGDPVEPTEPVDCVVSYELRLTASELGIDMFLVNGIDRTVFPSNPYTSADLAALEADFITYSSVIPNAQNAAVALVDEEFVFTFDTDNPNTLVYRNGDEVFSVVNSVGDCVEPKCLRSFFATYKNESVSGITLDGTPVDLTGYTGTLPVAITDTAGVQAVIEYALNQAGATYSGVSVYPVSEGLYGVAIADACGVDTVGLQSGETVTPIDELASINCEPVVSPAVCEETTLFVASANVKADSLIEDDANETYSITFVADAVSVASDPITSIKYEIFDYVPMSLNFGYTGSVPRTGTVDLTTMELLIDDAEMQLPSVGSNDILVEFTYCLESGKEVKASTTFLHGLNNSATNKGSYAFGINPNITIGANGATTVDAVGNLVKTGIYAGNSVAFDTASSIMLDDANDGTFEQTGAYGTPLATTYPVATNGIGRVAVEPTGLPIGDVLFAEFCYCIADDGSPLTTKKLKS